MPVRCTEKKPMISAAAAETNMAANGRQAKVSAGGSPDCLTTSAAV